MTRALVRSSSAPGCRWNEVSGKSYWQGAGNPVSFAPYFADIDRRLNNQYELDFMTVVGDKPQMQTIRLTVSAHAKVTAPQEVYVHFGAK